MIKLRGIEKHYRLAKVSVPALRGVDLDVEEGEFLSIMGPSGSGKSTLMNIIGCLDQPTAGQYSLSGEDVANKRENQLADIRNRKVGFVFQTFNLLSRLTAVQNVELPLIYRGVAPTQRRQRALAALEKVGLSDRLRHKPVEMSGGQQQRCAIARALAAEPSIILADEPTGNLDSRAGTEIMALFQDLHDQGITIVVVTHDETVAAYSERIIRLLDGLVVEDGPVVERLSAAERLTILKGKDQTATGS